jgi:hypothetical protein
MIELFINGQAADFTKAQFEAQDTPYPGGLSYEVRGEDPELVEFLAKEFFKGEVGPLDTEQASSLFMGLQMARMQAAMDGRPQPDSSVYFLNTVEKLILDGPRLTIRGVASPGMTA